MAGTFLATSGGNCLSTVIAAFGELEVAENRVQREQFETWLEQRNPVHGSMGYPGNVLVRRDTEGNVQHAAVCLGNDLLFHKKRRRGGRLDKSVALLRY